MRKTQSFERLKVEAEKCLALSEKLTNEKIEFESAIYAKVHHNIPLMIYSSILFFLSLCSQNVSLFCK